MKKTFIKDIKEKEQVSGTFLISKKEMGLSKTGKPYLNLKVMDSTGELEARVWEGAEELGKAFQKNDVVTLKGFSVAYQGGIQINVSSITSLKEGEYSIRDFLPASAKDAAKMIAELDSLVSSIADKHLKALLTAIFKDAEMRDAFMTAPAAKSMHHPYLGGLLEHVLSICGLVNKISEHYGKAVNRDLLLAGAILHDIGKVHELSYKRAFEYTDEGRLLGHITIGVELVEKKIQEVKDFPRETAVLLKHMLLSHHGQLEFGSPKRPKTLEAIILSYLDDMDAKVSAVMTLIGSGAAEGESSWSSYQRLFERYIFIGSKPELEEDRVQKDAPEKDNGKAETGTLNLFR